MEPLESLLKRYGKRPNSRFWIGKRPETRDSKLVEAILHHAGYPASNAPCGAADLIELNWKQAAQVLCFSASMSLAYETQKTPSRGSQSDALTALKCLDGKAKFFGNGMWGGGSLGSFRPISTSTFDAGVVGYDSINAFIFWVEEED